MYKAARLHVVKPVELFDIMLIHELYKVTEFGDEK